MTIEDYWKSKAYSLVLCIIKNTNLPLFAAFFKFYWSNIQLLLEVLHYTKKSPTVLILTSTLDLLQRRDASAQRKVYEQYSNTLYWTAFRYVRERMVAEDIVVEAFMKIFEAVTNIKFESLRNFEAWMKRIVINESLSYLRKHANPIGNVGWRNPSCHPQTSE